VRRSRSSRCRQSREFGRGLTSELARSGISATWDSGRYVLALWGVRVRVKLLWATGREGGEFKDTVRKQRDHLLLVRMRADYVPQEFFLIPPRQPDGRIPRRLPDKFPPELNQFRCTAPRTLIHALSSFRPPQPELASRCSPDSARGAATH
jgi:hypothetical protein